MITSFIKDKIKNYFNKNNKKKYFEKFKEILKEQNISDEVISKIITNYEYNFGNMFVESTSEDDNIAYGIMWYTLYTYCSSLTYEHKMNCKRIAIIGPPGCGKTSYIFSLIKSLNYDKIVFDSDNDDSYYLLRSMLHKVELIKKDNIPQGSHYCEIYEYNNLDNLTHLIKKYERIRIFLCIPMNFDHYALRSYANKIGDHYKKISGIIITKTDFNKDRLALCLEVCRVFKNKIIAFSVNELKSNKREIKSSQTLNDEFLNNVFSKKYDMSSIKTLFNNNVNAIDLETYYTYLKFLLKFESLNTDTIMNMINKVAGKMNFNNDVMKNIKNLKELIPSDSLKIFKTHINIINSMRKCEKKCPWILNENRILRIANGSGVTKIEVKKMINDFYKYKQAMKQMNNNSLLDGIR